MNPKQIRSLLAAAAIAAVSAGQTIRNVPIQETSVLDGAEMYQSYCASCHGAGGKGNGPAAPALKIPPTDLTMLSAHNNGEFPGLEVMSAMSRARGGHGSEQMPVWGNLFHLSGQTDAVIHLRLYNITRYIEAIQVPAERSAPQRTRSRQRLIGDVSRVSGVEMYHSFCASCHGADGRGNGPGAVVLNKQPADLTLLSRNNGGKYPEMKVNEILGARPGTEAHGSREMPVWGDMFRESREDQGVVTVRLRNLNRYLESMQRK